MNGIISQCREHERRRQKIEEKRDSLDKDDDWAKKELDSIYEQEKERISSLLESMTKEQWREVLGRRADSGEFSASMDCLITNLGKTKNPEGVTGVIPKELIKAPLLVRREQSMVLRWDKNVVKQVFLCRPDLGAIRRKIHPFCQKIYKADDKTENHFSESICREELENLERLYDEISGTGASSASNSGDPQSPVISNNPQAPVIRNNPEVFQRTGNNGGNEPATTAVVSGSNKPQSGGGQVVINPKPSRRNDDEDFNPQCNDYKEKIFGKKIYGNVPVVTLLMHQNVWSINFAKRKVNVWRKLIWIPSKEGVIQSEERLRLREKMCCYEMPEFGNQVCPNYELSRGVPVSKNLIFDTKMKYVSSSYRHLSNDVNDWLRMSIG